jgi:hypothetical protein
MTFNRDSDGKSYRELRANYHASLTAFAFLLLYGNATKIVVLSALRNVLVAHRDMLQHTQCAHDDATRAAVCWELERVERELEAHNPTSHTTNQPTN